MARDPLSDPILGGAKSMEDNLTRNEPTVFASYGLIGAILLFGGAGYFLDRWLDTAPWLLLAGLGAGVIVGFARLYGLVRRS
jgi:F0F1-type ATP synthase assembly protein I